MNQKYFVGSESGCAAKIGLIFTVINMSILKGINVPRFGNMTDILPRVPENVPSDFFVLAASLIAKTHDANKPIANHI